MRIEIADEDNF